MPKYKCVVHEVVAATIEIEIEADDELAAAQKARDAWVGDGAGDRREDVEERWVEIDGVVYETNDWSDDEPIQPCPSNH
jgi:hypothetical protein